VGIAALSTDKNIVFAVKTTTKESEEAEDRYVWKLVQKSHLREILGFHNLQYSSIYSGRGKNGKDYLCKSKSKFHKLSWSRFLNDMNYKASYKFIPDDNTNDPECLNLWSGLALNYVKVIQKTNWFQIRIILNHIKFTWANSDAEYFQILRRLATVVCRPWLKTEVAMAIGGECQLNLRVII
jgi:hypothetical protein